LVSPDSEHVEIPILSKCGWSPFEGHKFSHRIDKTWVNGHLRYSDDCVQPGPFGQALTYQR